MTLPKSRVFLFLLCLSSSLSCLRSLADEPAEKRRFEIEFRDVPALTENEKNRWKQIRKSNFAASIRTAQPRASYSQSWSHSSGPIMVSSEHQIPSECSQSLGAYTTLLYRRLKANWVRPPGTKGKRVVVRFSIHTNGSITHLGSLFQPADASFEEAALSAIERSNPLPSLPSGVQNTLDVKITFDDHFQ